MNPIAALREENEELRERLRQLTEQLAETRFSFPRDLRLTPTEALVLRHLLSRDLITRRSTMLLLYSDRAGEHPGDNAVDMQIVHLRKKLRPLDIRIETIWGRGWRIVDRPAAAARFT